jgi:hypothetical protein
MVGRSNGLARVLACALVLMALALAGGLTASRAATTVSVSGFVFRDLDNDGIRDAGEPGVPGIRVHRSTGNSTPNTVTGADGSYTLTGLSPASSGVIMIRTGWFRSQCATLTCAAGPGPDNDFAVVNAYVQYPLAQVSADTVNLNLGLVPDWPGSTAAPPSPVGGVVPANQVDVASRLSWARSTCPEAVYNVCRIGDTFTVSSQVYNQGTTSLTGITAVLDLPPGDRFATGDPARDVRLVSATSSPDITAIMVSPIDSATQSVAITLAGALPPGAGALISTDGVVVGGPGTPGCVVGAVTSACPKGEPQGAPLTLRVTHMEQAGDPDSFGPDCTPERATTSCSTGIHDKQVEPDEVDPVGHNVVASAGGATSYNLRSELWVLSPRPPTAAAPGSTVVWRALAFNDGPETALPGWKLTLILPNGFTTIVPTANAVRSCAKGTTSSGYPSVTCTGKGPLSPGVASFAVDVRSTAPATVTAQRALVFVAPLGSQHAETVPLGAAPTSPADAAQTPTDNDSAAIVQLAPG